MAFPARALSKQAGRGADEIYFPNQAISASSILPDMPGKPV